METKTDLERDDLKGRVKRIIGYKVENYDPNSDLPQKIRHEAVYDSQGRKIEDIYYKEDGNISSKETWKYDEQGKLLESNSDSYYGDEHSFLNCKYDEKGNKIEEIRGYDGHVTKQTWKYDEKGNKIEYIRYDDETMSIKNNMISYEEGERGNRVKTIWYEYEFGETFNVERYYNEHEKLIEAIYYGENGNISRKRTWKYDDKGNLIERIVYNSNSKETWKYDDKGNLIEHIVHNSKGNISRKRTRKCKYDDKGNLIEHIEYNSKGNISWKNTSEYDNQGNLIEDIVYNSKGNITRKYDDKGNRIEHIRCNRNGKIVFKETWKYDSQGNKMEEYKGRDGKKWQETFSKFIYENNKTTIEKVIYSDGNISGEETWRYDEKGNLIEVLERKKQNTGKWKEELIKYEYDDQDNWIQEMIFKQRGKKQIISKWVQEIEYYQDEE